MDIVLADINMPVMDGLTMIERLRENPDFAELPIVVVSTESSDARIEQVKNKGVEFIHKPFTPEQVAKAVRGMVEGVENAC